MVNQAWRVATDTLPRYLEVYNLDNNDKYAALDQTFTAFLDYSAPFRCQQPGQEDQSFKDKLAFLKANYDLSKKSIYEYLFKDDICSFKQRIAERFEGYEEYLIDRDFWNDRNVSTLVKMLEKETQDISPEDLSTIRKLVDFVYKAKESPLQNEMDLVNIYQLFSAYKHQKVFVHTLLLKRHKVKGSSLVLSETRFKMLLSCFQFICLSSLL